MASSDGEVAANNKRKVDGVVADEKKKKKKATKKSKEDEAKQYMIDGLVHAITTKETASVQAWRRVVTELDKAGISVRGDDVCEGGITWTWDDNIYIQLSMVLSRDKDHFSGLVPEYHVFCRLGLPGHTRIFKDGEWDELVDYLLASMARARCRSDRTHILTYLETELDRWKELLDAIQEAKTVPPFTEYSIDDGLITLDWTRKEEGFQVTVVRSTQDYGDGDVYERFCVRKSPLKQNDASIVRSMEYFDSVKEAVDQVAALLT